MTDDNVTANNNETNTEDYQEAQRMKWTDERKALWYELNVLKDKYEIEQADLQRLFGIQGRASYLTGQIENSMQICLQRSATLASFNVQRSSTPATRRS